jgi:hypothetical protein
MSLGKRHLRHEQSVRAMNDRMVAILRRDGRAEYDLVCECLDEDCDEVVRMPAPAYAALRTNDRRYVVLPRHARAERETAVDETETYVIVERTSADNGPPRANGVDSATAKLLRYLEVVRERSLSPPDSHVLGPDHWLRHCHGFHVVGAGRNGSVEDVRLDGDEVTGLLVRFGRAVVRIRPVDVDTIDPQRRVVFLDEQSLDV